MPEESGDLVIEHMLEEALDATDAGLRMTSFSLGWLMAMFVGAVIV